MSQITVKGKIDLIQRAETMIHGVAFASFALVRIEDAHQLTGIKHPPADWVEGQEVEITIRSVEK